MKIFNGPTKLGKILPIPLPYYFVFILWKRISDFIERQHLRKHGRIEWNIERTIVDETNIRRPQINSFISHMYYECVYRPEDHRHDLIHKQSTKMVVLLVSL